MAFSIDPDKVTNVLLPDGWWIVEPGSFSFDRWEVCPSCSWDEEPVHPMSSPDFARGFTFIGISVADWEATEGELSGRRITGPWPSIQAIQHHT